MKKIIVATFVVVSAYQVQAQKNRQVFDTTKKTVVITSAYKPQVKPAAKINFSGATPISDTGRPVLSYQVPAQNLFFSYQPATLKPLALSVDSSVNWNNDNYIKLGFGNYRTPFAQAGFSFGDGKNSAITLSTKYISQKGNLPFQQYSQAKTDLIGIFTQGNSEWHGKLGFENRNQFLYGYDPSTLVFEKDDLRQRFTTISGMVGLRNKSANEFGITYDPTLSLHVMTDNHKANEVNFLLNAPITKTFGRAFGFNVGLTADVTTYKPAVGNSIKNNLYYLTPAVVLKTPNFLFNVGFTPSWDNQNFTLLPNFTASAKLSDERFVLQGGWIGYYQKNDYRTLSEFNPFIAQPGALINTRIKEQYAGFKGSAGSHFTYNARVSTLSFVNAPLFVNDNGDGKSFMVVYEQKMNALRLHGEVGYTMQEKFSLLAGATINQYTGLKSYERAYGLLPFEITGALRWQVLKDVHIKSDVFFWDGPRYRMKNGEAGKLSPAIDVNAGVDFKVLPQLSLWLQFNNILNNRYERWNQYEVLGFNVQGGIIYSFSQKH